MENEILDREEKEKTSLEIVDGMLLEVLMSDEQVLFEGRVTELDGETMRLVDPAGGAVPPVEYGTEVKLRGTLADGRIVVYHGTVLGSTSAMWKIGDLSNWYGWNRRDFYRQSVSVEGRVLRTKNANPGLTRHIDTKVACRLLDISGGGTLVACSRAVYGMGDQLSITDAHIIPGEKPFSFNCIIKRIERARFNNIYGCQFYGMDQKEQDRLVRAVFKLQAQERRDRADGE